MKGEVHLSFSCAHSRIRIETYRDLAGALVRGGVHAIIIETMNDWEEVQPPPPPPLPHHHHHHTQPLESTLSLVYVARAGVGRWKCRLGDVCPVVWFSCAPDLLDLHQYIPSHDACSQSRRGVPLRVHARWESH